MGYWDDRSSTEFAVTPDNKMALRQREVDALGNFVRYYYSVTDDMPTKAGTELSKPTFMTDALAVRKGLGGANSDATINNAFERDKPWLTTGSANDYSISPTPPLEAAIGYQDGQRWTIRFHETSTANVVYLNISGRGQRRIYIAGGLSPTSRYFKKDSVWDVVYRSADNAFYAINATLDRSQSNWLEIGAYTVPGSGMWVAPDINGDGSNYLIAILAIGGGGGGSVAIRGTATSIVFANGGASGYSAIYFIEVTPGVSYPYVVGNGGSSFGYSGSAIYAQSGNNGGTTSFAGNVALGGEGGLAITRTATSIAAPARGSDGGQGSEGYSHYSYNAPSQNVPSGGRATHGAYGERVDNAPPVYGGWVRGGNTQPLMCINPFTNQRILSAGGSAQGEPNANPVGQTLTDIPGASAAAFSATGNAIAQDATGVGNGGGAAIATINNTAACGAGAPGGVFVYVRTSRQNVPVF